MTSSSRDEQQTNGESGADGGRYAIGVLGKAFDLVDAVADRNGATMSELSAAAGINRSTCVRILSNLSDRGYIERDRDGRYHLGIRLLQLGARAASGIELRSVARPILEGLRNEVDETVNLAIPADDGIVYIDILESAHGLRMAATVGMRDFYHSAALGKAMLSRFPDERLEVVVGPEPFPQRTWRTLQTLVELRDELLRVRAQGYAIDDEENEAGARCIAAAIVDQHGDCVGAVSISGPSSRVDAERVPTLAARVREAARAISHRLGYAEPVAVADREHPRPVRAGI